MKSFSFFPKTQGFKFSEVILCNQLETLKKGPDIQEVMNPSKVVLVWLDEKWVQHPYG